MGKGQEKSNKNNKQKLTTKEKAEKKKAKKEIAQHRAELDKPYGERTEISREARNIRREEIGRAHV